MSARQADPHAEKRLQRLRKLEKMGVMHIHKSVKEALGAPQPRCKSSAACLHAVCCTAECARPQSQGGSEGQGREACQGRGAPAVRASLALPSWPPGANALCRGPKQQQPQQPQQQHQQRQQGANAGPQPAKKRPRPDGDADPALANAAGQPDRKPMSGAAAAAHSFEHTHTDS
jgi:hypothetical protein